MRTVVGLHCMMAAAAGTLPVQGAFVHGRTDEEERLRLHVVLAQVFPNPSQEGAVHEVLPKLVALTKDAAAHGADVIVFPEYFLSGATHSAWNSARDTPALSKHAIAPWMQTISDLAAETDIAIVTGSVVQRRALRHDDAEQGLYNTAYFVDRTGAVRGIYTKRNLWHAERSILTRATDESHPAHEQAASFVFETRRGLSVRAAMVMCWDLMFPESFRRLLGPRTANEPTSDLDRAHEWQGPDVVFAPTCWYADDAGPHAYVWNPACEDVSLKTECFVCMCNAAGPARTCATSPRGLGLSSCNAPLLGCTARIEHEHEALLYHTLDLRVLHTARAISRIRSDGYDGKLPRP